MDRSRRLEEALLQVIERTKKLEADRDNLSKERKSLEEELSNYKNALREFLQKRGFRIIDNSTTVNLRNPLDLKYTWKAFVGTGSVLELTDNYPSKPIEIKILYGKNGLTTNFKDLEIANVIEKPDDEGYKNAVKSVKEGLDALAEGIKTLILTVIENKIEDAKKPDFRVKIDKNQISVYSSFDRENSTHTYHLNITYFYKDAHTDPTFSPYYLRNHHEIVPYSIQVSTRRGHNTTETYTFHLGSDPSEIEEELLKIAERIRREKAVAVPIN